MSIALAEYELEQMDRLVDEYVLERRVHPWYRSSIGPHRNVSATMLFIEEMSKLLRVEESK